MSSTTTTRATVSRIRISTKTFKPLALTETEIEDLVAFLASLTSAQYRDQGAIELARQREIARSATRRGLSGRNRPGLCHPACVEPIGSGGVSVSNRLCRRDDGSFLVAARSVLCDRLLDRVQQILIANRFGQEFDRTTLHGPNRHRHIGVVADEDNRDVEVHGDELSLKVKAASPRQSDIEHKAGGSARAAGLEEFINRSEQLRLQPNGSDKAADRLPDCRIVIDDGRCRLRP